MESIQSLMGYLERSPQWQSSSQFRQILAMWPQLVGEAVAQHSQPSKIYRQVLQVTVANATWSQTLTFERSRILQKLHQQLPATQKTIRDLRFAMAEWHRYRQRSPSQPSPTLDQHPSWAAAPNSKSPHHRPQTANLAFQQWADYRQAQLANQSRCPRCDSPCPSQEITRWSVCAICIAHQWHHWQGQKR